MAGLEILAALFSLFGCAVACVIYTAFVDEHRKRRFLGSVTELLEPVVDVESGDISLPLSFTVGDVRVQAALRGDVEVWQLERNDVAITGSAFAVVYRGWRAPDARDLAEVGDLGARLLVYAGDDGGGARRLLARARADLSRVLGRRTRRCLVGKGRAFLEVTRRGFAVDDLRDAIVRLDALLAVLAGLDPHVTATTSSGQAAIAGPSGVPVPW